MRQRPFGGTGLIVSVLGLGAGQVGQSSVTEAEAAALLQGALDAGVTLIDTARSYGLSEERIGRQLSARREEFVLSSKGGAGVDGVADWSAAAVERSVEDALRRLRTDVIDVFHLHSCSREVLERGEVIDALERAVAAGKVRVPAYSGDNQAAGVRRGVRPLRLDRDQRQPGRPVEPAERAAVARPPWRDRQTAGRERRVAVRRASDRGLRRRVLGSAAAAGP